MKISYQLMNQLLAMIPKLLLDLRHDYKSLEKSKVGDTSVDVFKS